MHDDLDDDYEPEHDQLLDTGDELEAMFGDELAELAELDGQGEPQQNHRQDKEGSDPEDEYQAGLDEDW